MNKGDCIQEFGEEKYDEGKSDGISQGESKAKEDFVKNMLDDNVPLEKISQYTGLSVSEIEKIKESR